LKKEDYTDYTDYTDEEFDEAISGLLEKGLIEKSTKDGIIYYELTTLGNFISDHIYSELSTRN
jgi:hypothetical protein